MQKNIIILNGKRYDAVTGALMGAVTEAKALDAVTSMKKHGADHSPASQLSVYQDSSSAAIAHSKRTERKTRHHHGQPKVITAHKPQSAKTLMRRAVRKPTKSQHTPLKRQYPISHISTDIGIQPKVSVHAVDSTRLKRAEQIRTSQHVARFGGANHANQELKPKLQHIAVAPVPHHAEPKEAHKTAVHHEINIVNIAEHALSAAAAQAAAVMSPMQQTQPAFVPAGPGHMANQAQLQPVAVPVFQPAPLESPDNDAPKENDIFKRALAAATSHEEPAYEYKKTGRFAKFKNQKLAGSAAMLGAVLVIGGFVMYVNKSSVELRVASVRAGFSASMPAYAPDGFEKQATQTKDGKVAISFISPGSSSGFTLTQEPSTWDSQTLFDTVVAQQPNLSYQTIQDSGRTIYIYGENDAAWVDGGVLYKVTGDARLTSVQISQLAGSM